MSLSLSSEPEKKQNLVIRPFLQINNRTDHSLVLAESNRIIKPNENFSLEFKFSCDEEYNNKFIKLSKEQIKTFCQNLIQNKFISEDIQNKGKVLKILLNSLDLKESKELSLNEMIRNNQLEIKFHSEIFVLGFYRNFFYHKKQLMFYLVKNLIHDNRNYILVSNQTANNIVYKNELQLIPFSSHLMFSDEKINTKSFKTSDLSDFQSEFNITSIILPCLKYHMIRNNNSDRISFQIIVPQISVKLCLEAENEINFDLEVHVRLFQNDKFDILINKFKVCHFFLYFCYYFYYFVDRKKLQELYL